MRTELKRLQRDLGRTLVYVTHDQVEAMSMADRILVLREGVVQQIAPPEDIYHRPANRFVATVVGSPPMNFLPATAARSNGTPAPSPRLVRRRRPRRSSRSTTAPLLARHSPRGRPHRGRGRGGHPGQRLRHRAARRRDRRRPPARRPRREGPRSADPEAEAGSGGQGEARHTAPARLLRRGRRAPLRGRRRSFPGQRTSQLSRRLRPGSSLVYAHTLDGLGVPYVALQDLTPVV